MLEVLTARERQVMARIAGGRSNKQVAADLKISPRTVESHRGSLMRKLQISTVAEITRLALEAGLVSGTLAPRSASDWLLSESIDGVCFGLCEMAHRLTKRPTAVVVQDPTTLTASVAAASAGADRRLLRTAVAPTSAAGHACMGCQITSGHGMKELFGGTHEDRRRREERGTAFPLRNGGGSVGALVVFELPKIIDPSLIGRIIKLARAASPVLGRALAVRAAEQRPLIDNLSGQPNQRALEQAMRDHGEGPCSLLYVAIDQFGQLHEAARDLALKQAATVFRNTLRDYDVPARIVNEEFALFLPDTPLHHAFAVANRVQIAVAGSAFDLAGEQRALTCSLGIASVPETVSDLNDLLAMANQALDLAKAQGHNRVEAAPATCTMSSTSEGVDEPDRGFQGGPLD